MASRRRKEQIARAWKKYEASDKGRARKRQYGAVMYARLRQAGLCIVCQSESITKVRCLACRVRRSSQ